MRQPIEEGFRLILFVIGLVWVGITLLAAVWFFYFAYRVRQSGKKVHYLKKQTDERCGEELTNARVDYVKNIFIAAICLAELVGGVAVFVNFALFDTIYGHPLGPIPGCSKLSHSVIETVFNYKFSRVYWLVSLSSFLVHTSLVHTLTSYMVNAYAEKRVVKLSRREKLLLLLLFIQLAVTWLSVFEWRSFVIVSFLVTTSVFPTHLILFYRYSRKLYSAIRRRALDAWYEDTELHKRMDGMLKEYYHSSIAYGLSILFLAIFWGIFSSQFFTIFYNHPCTLNYLFHTNGSWLKGIFNEGKDETNISLKYIRDLLGVFVFSWVLALHVYILLQAVYRQIKRRRAYNRYTGTRRTELYRPLIGNN
eukprot:TRINITY_DN4881_c0_g1_i3.p1 TRINITY_DN4881_c0_g1~~TRINITY_DN4881_c0_g1_i3.p1  ORF type:complete len:364 (-),score=62.20 TRINITY_DN4881_c0_g1_i3:23-1114(-)